MERQGQVNNKGTESELTICSGIHANFIFSETRCIGRKMPFYIFDLFQQTRLYDEYVILSFWLIFVVWNVNIDHQINKVTNNRTFITLMRARIILRAFEREWARVCFIDSRSFSRQVGNVEIVLRVRQRRCWFHSTLRYIHARIYAVCYNVQYLRNSFYQQISRLEKVLERGRREEIKNLSFLLFNIFY